MCLYWETLNSFYPWNFYANTYNNLTFCWPCIMQWFLIIVQLDAQILFNVFIYLFIVLYMFRACHAHHQEQQIVSIQLLVIVTPCWWQCWLGVNSQPALPSCYMRTDRQTEWRTDLHSNMTKLIVAFRNFANPAKIPWRNLLVCKTWSSMKWDLIL